MQNEVMEVEENYKPPGRPKKVSNVKPCGFRVKEGDPFWHMIRGDGNKLTPSSMIETKESLKDEMSTQSILAENGNYYRTEQDCSNRIKLLNQ